MWEHTEKNADTPDNPEVVASTQLSVSSVEPITSVEEAEPEPPTVFDEPLIIDVSENEPEPEIIKVENPYKEYFLGNSDMVGWLKIPDTEIDFPVMWTPEDENYYLYRGFDKEYSRYGLPLLDTDSSMDPLSTNLIIHGHNIKNSTFYFLLQYKEEEYFKKHPKIYLYGKDYEHVYEVMAVFRSQVFYVTDTCFKYYKFFNAYTAEEFNDFYDNVKEMALYDTGVTAEFGDRLLTLSTCSSHTENGRFVVVAKEVEPGEQYLALDAESEEVSGNN